MLQPLCCSPAVRRTHHAPDLLFGLKISVLVSVSVVRPYVLLSLSNCSAIFLLFAASDFLTEPMLPRLHPRRYRRSAGHQLLAGPRTVCSICLRRQSMDSVSSLPRLAAD